MVTTVRQRSGFVWYLSTWVQAIVIVYAIGIGLVLLGAAVVLPLRAAIELVSWVAALVR